MKGRESRIRLRIGIFGKRNVGKSSIFNRLARHRAAIVSPEPGTTTDPVKKAFEHHFLGPILLIDTAGLDDRGVLGGLRVEKTMQIIDNIDLALMVLETAKLGQFEDELFKILKENNTPQILVINKIDINETAPEDIENLKKTGHIVVRVSSETGEGIEDLMDAIQAAVPTFWDESRPLIRDLYNKKEAMILAVDHDPALYPGRLLTSHNRIIRDALDNDAQCIVLQKEQVQTIINRLKNPPKFIVADLSIAGGIRKTVPESIPVTTTGYIMARYNGDIPRFKRGVEKFKETGKGCRVLLVNTGKLADRVIGGLNSGLVGGGCTDMVEIAGFKLFPGDLSEFSILILAGEENVSSKSAREKIENARKSGIPMTNADVLLSEIDPEYKFVKKLFE